MYPDIAFGSLHVSSFAVAVVLASLLGATLGTQQARYAGVDPNIVWRFIPWAVVGGIVGGKLYQAVIHVFNGRSGLTPFTSTGGLVFYGALAGGVLVAWLFVRREGYASNLLFDLGAPCVAFAHAVGRIGCLLVGDDYGKPSTLPWAIAFPEGAPPSTAENLRRMGARIPDDIAGDTVMRVHPIQIYEAIALTVFGFVLWRASRRPHQPWTVFALYAVLYGVWRFAVEFLRPKDDLVPGIGLSSAQLVSIGLVGLGVVLMMRARARR